MNDDLFPVSPPQFHLLRQPLAELAAQGIYLGTSSWKYEGWLDLLYTPSLYATRGRFSQSKFEKTCLSEYAQVFKTVCLDAGYYQFPTEALIGELVDQVPGDFRLSIKVTEEITVKTYPRLSRYGKRAGEPNPHFLDSGLFIEKFLTPLSPFRETIGALIFEFSPFSSTTWKAPEDFVACLEPFLSRLPPGWNYGVEVRNPELLTPLYFKTLHRFNVSHLFNQWSRMPSVLDQLKRPESLTADYAVARFLLKPGRTYEEAVSSFKPYRAIQEPLEDARAALEKLITPAVPNGRPSRRFLYVNNRLEGCALWTIYAVLSGLIARGSTR